MKTVDKLVRKQFKPLSLIRIDWECAFLYNLEIIFLVGGP